MNKQKRTQLRKELTELFRMFNFTFYEGKLKLKKLLFFNDNDYPRTKYSPKKCGGWYERDKKEIIIIIDEEEEEATYRFFHEIAHLIYYQYYKKEDTNYPHNKTYDKILNDLVEQYICITLQGY